MPPSSGAERFWLGSAPFWRSFLRPVFFLDPVQLKKKRKNYIDILEGAFCSSPDSCMLWQVNYKGEKSFKFHGRIIICTQLTREEIKKTDKLKYIARDGMKL